MTDASTNSPIHPLILRDERGNYIFMGNQARMKKDEVIGLNDALIIALNDQNALLDAFDAKSKRDEAHIAEIAKAESGRQFMQYVISLSISLSRYGAVLRSFRAGDDLGGSFTLEVHNMELRHMGPETLEVWSPLLQQAILSVNPDGTLPLQSEVLLETLIDHNSIPALSTSYQELLAAKNVSAAEARFLRIYTRAAHRYIKYCTEQRVKMTSFEDTILKLQSRDPEAFAIFCHFYNQGGDYEPTTPRRSRNTDTLMKDLIQRQRNTNKRLGLETLASVVQQAIEPFQGLNHMSSKAAAMANLGDSDEPLLDLALYYSPQDRPMDLPLGASIKRPVTVDRTPYFTKEFIGRSTPEATPDTGDCS